MFENVSWFDLDKVHTHFLSFVVIPKPMYIMRERQFYTGTLYATTKIHKSVNGSVCGGIRFCCNFWIQM